VSPTFTINFRREALARRLQRERYRVVGLALWLSYFGVLTVVIGLYGLNCQTTAQRALQIEQQTYRLSSLQERGEVSGIPPAQVGEVEKFATNPWQWHERMVHLGRLLPAQARITSFAVNPDNASGSADQNKVVIEGQLHSARGEDYTQGVMKVLAALQSDSVFAGAYPSIKLVSTHAAAATGQPAEFVIQCH
jgi:hypothetical protein